MAGSFLAAATAAGAAVRGRSREMAVSGPGCEKTAASCVRELEVTYAGGEDLGVPVRLGYAVPNLINEPLHRFKLIA